MFDITFIKLLLIVQLCLSSGTRINFDSLTIWLYSSKIIRVTYEPIVKYAIPRYNSSLIVSFDASNISVDYNISQPNKQVEPNIYHIFTDDLLIIVNNDTSKWIGFYDIKTNKSILTEPISSANIMMDGKKFLNTTDPITNKPIYQIVQTWQLRNDSDNDDDYNDIPEALYGLGEYQNGF